VGTFPNKATQFKKGVSGNPDGPKPGYKLMKTILRELIEGDVNYEDLAGKKKRMSAAQAVMLAQVAKAIHKQDTNAAKFVVEELEGLKTQKIESESTNFSTNVNFMNQAVDKDMDDYALERVKQMKEGK